ncbi:MAG: MFS transporter [Phycisphaerales bacterium]|nr:MFS transporter [Phycisphaerales bacterium]
MPTTPANPPIIRGWILWFIATAFVIYQLALQTSYAALDDKIIETVGMSTAASGLLAASFLFTYALIQLPAGLILDRGKVQWILFLAALLCAAATLCFSFSTNYWELLASRAFMGATAGFAFPGAGLIARRWIRPSQFAIAMGLIDMLFSGGAVLGNAGLAQLVDIMSWQGIVQWMAAAGGVIALLIVLFIRSAPHENVEPSMIGKISLKKSFLDLIGTRQVWLGMIFYAGICANVFGFYGFWDVPLQQAFGFTKNDSLMLNSWLFIGMGLGAVISGFIADWWGRRKPLLVLGSIGGTIAVAFVLFTPATTYFAAMTQLFINGLLLGVSVLVFPAVCESLPRGYSGAAIGIVNAAGIMSGAIFQFVPGLFISEDHTATLESYQKTLVIFLLVMFLATLAALKMHETRPGWDNAVTPDNENLDPEPQD